jgi:uncharacterized protein involved in exopolysaccharide biosynthesis
MRVVDHSLKGYSAVIVKYQYLLLVILLCAIGVAVVISLVMPKVYEATTTFFYPQSEETFNLYSSRTTLRSVPFPGVRGSEAVPHLAIFKSRSLVSLVAKELEGRSVTDLLQNTRFDYVPTSNLFKVTIRDQNPKLAAHTADLYVDQINIFFQNLSLRPTKRVERFVRRELESATGNLNRVRDDITQFQLENRAMALGSKTKRIVNKQLNAQLKIDTMRTRFELNEVKIENFEEQMAIEGGMRIPTTALGSKRIIKKLQPRLINLQLQLEKLKTRYTENHRVVLNKQYQIEQVKEALARETEKLYLSQVEPKAQFHEKYRRSLIKENVKQNILYSQMEVLKRKVDDYDQEIAKLPELKRRLATLTFEERHYKQLQKLLDQRLLELKVQENVELSNYFILDRAQVPTSPAFPNLRLNIVVALIFSAIGGLFYCFFLEYLDRSRQIKLDSREIVVK